MVVARPWVASLSDLQKIEDMLIIPCFIDEETGRLRGHELDFQAPQWEAGRESWHEHLALPWCLGCCRPSDAVLFMVGSLPPGLISPHRLERTTSHLGGNGAGLL